MVEMPYPIFVFLHASAMCAAIALLLAGEVLLLFARRGWYSPARLAFLASRVGSVAAAIGIVSGVAVLFIGGWPLRTPWLLASLALVAAMAIVERRLVRPWQALSVPVLRRNAAGPGIQAVATDRRGLFGRLAVIALFVAVGVLMTAKPGLAML
jgi:uncharacterized membrane protein